MSRISVTDIEHEQGRRYRQIGESERKGRTQKLQNDIRQLPGGLKGRL